jgi:hypothetical protein
MHPSVPCCCCPGLVDVRPSLRPIKLTSHIVAHTSILRGGQVAVVMRRFELEPCLAYIENFELNEMVLVPPIVIAIIMSGLGKKVGFQEATTRHLGLSQWFNLLDVVRSGAALSRFTIK